MRMGDELLEAMQELLNHNCGKITLRTTQFPVSPACETITSDDIVATRKILKMSQGIGF